MLRSMRFRGQPLAACRALMIISILWSPVPGQTAGFLRLMPVEGEGAFNSIRTGYVHPPAVRITDESDNSAVGAEVTFTFPAVGAGAVLPGGGMTLTARTDETGLARCPAYKPNSEEGRFRIKVTASYQGKTGTVVINQSNSRAGGTSISEKKKGKGYWILALVAGGAVGGILAATGGSSSSPVAPPTTLNAGAITVGGPR